MDNLLWYLLDIIEVIIGFVGLAIALNKKKPVGYVLAAAYWIYVFSDILRVANIGFESRWDVLLQLGPIIALVAFWMLYKEE